MTETMQGRPICGPVMLQIMTGLSLAEVLEPWPGGWVDLNSDKTKEGIPNDTPFDHWFFLEKIGITWKRVTCQEILKKKTKPGKTGVLLHLAKEPKTWWEKIKSFFVGLTKQHWCVVLFVGEDSIVVDWGNGKKETFFHSRFEFLYSAGWPACAYEIDVPEKQAEKLPSWKKKIAEFTKG
jgi:hypothetical protein